MCVVDRAFLVIMQDFIGLGRGFEFGFGAFSFIGRDLVRVMGKCCLLSVRN